MPTITVENYLKTLYVEQHRDGAARPGAGAHGDGANGGTLVAMGTLASAMRVAPGTATAMVKALAESGLVAYAPRGGVRLTAKGEKLALHVLRRHRLVEQFLVQVLGLDWSEVDEEAEELEHAISDKVLDRIDALLGHPQVDPHGDPIPTAKGKVARRALLSLAQCDLGRPMRVARVMDQDPAFLQFADRNSLKPGTVVVVKSRDAVADAVQIHPRSGARLTIGSAAAAKILVEAV